MSAFSDINRVKFISEDFATYRAEADTFFQQQYPNDFNDLIATNLGNALMDQLAFAMQSLGFAVNRRASELFLDTARLNKSVVKLAKMLGYAIKPASPPTCDLTINLTGGPYSFPIVFPVGYQWQGPGDTVYEYRGSIPFTILPGNTTAVMPISEGITRQSSFVSDASRSQQFSVFGIPDTQFLYAEDLTVTVDGSPWTRQDRITYEPTNQYEVIFNDSPPKLRFGDGIAGNVPVNLSQIVMTFVYGKGSSGAIGINQISGPVNPLVINQITIPMALTNTVSDVGEDPEDIRHVRVAASTFFRTQNAAVVKSDYDSIAALQSGVALADAQIMRGVSGDITIQGFFHDITSGLNEVNSAISGIMMSSVTGIEFLGVGGMVGLYVSGIPFLGSDVSGNVTGIGFLGVAGTSGLYVSGTESLGISDLTAIQEQAVSGGIIINNAVSGLEAYLSQAFSDTSKANNVQMVILSVDANNKYISPSMTVVTNVQTVLDSLKDAVVTVNVISGISRIVECDVEVDIGISQTAVKTDVEARSTNALISPTQPVGLLVRRTASVSLYKSDIQTAIEAANASGDVKFLNIRITYPLDLLDVDGNLIIGKQKIIQYRTVKCRATKRVLSNNQVIDLL